jgi:PKD repeat protein
MNRSAGGAGVGGDGVGLNSRARRSPAIGIVALLGAALLAAFGAASASAVVAKFAGHGYGITPLNGAGEAALIAAHRQSAPVPRDGVRPFDEPPFGGSLLENLEEGPVMHKVTTHVIYWDPSSQFTSTTKGIVEGFLSNVQNDSGLATNTFAVAGQYTDPTGNAAYNSTFGGAILDEHAYPSSGNCTIPNEVDKGPYVKCLFDSQLQTELSTVIGEESLSKGPTQLYFVLLPHNVATCLPETIEGKQVCSNNFFCAYHSYINPGTANEVIYADIPFSLLDSSFAKGCQADGHEEIQLPNGDKGTSDTETRFADVALKYLTHEYIEAATDPLVNFETAWVDEEGLEIADKCNQIPFSEEEEGEPGFDKHAFTPPLGGSAAGGTLFNQAIDTGHYYLQSQWDNAAEECLMEPLGLGAGSFAVPSAAAESPVGFTGGATDPYGGFDPSWTFGDGGTATGVSPTHTYSVAGEFTVTMTPKDSLTGSTGAPISHTIKVSAPTAKVTLSVERTGAGKGAVASSPAGISCGATCSASFAEGQKLLLTATAESGSTFVSWSGGACEGATANTCEFAIAKALTVKAEFAVGASGSSAGGSVAATPTPVVPSGVAVPKPGPAAASSDFTSPRGTLNAKTGALTFTTTVANPGTFSWLATFQNGKFGAFASASGCKHGFVRLGGRCRPARIVFAKGSKVVGAAGTVTVTLKPSPSALRALKNALRKGKGLPVLFAFTFKSSLGAGAVTRSPSLTVKLKK